MAKRVALRGMVLGEGRAKICVPVMGAQLPALLAQAQAARQAAADIVEWRADWFTEMEAPEKVCAALRALRDALGQTPLLFTCRSREEGGQWQMDAEYYVKLNAAVAESGLADLVDAELFAGEESLREIVRMAHAQGVPVMVSSHDFEKTPPQHELLEGMRRMRALGGDVVKVAVMPQNAQDVLVLLGTTDKAAREELDCPVVSMAMGELGKLSRVAGGAFGSCMTFGKVGTASAPGQMEVSRLREAMEMFESL